MNTTQQPLETAYSANRNVHIASYRRDGSLVVAPGSYGRSSALACIATMPILLYACHHFSAPTGVWIGAILFPIFAAGGFLVSYIVYVKFGTSIIVHPKTRKIQITGFRHGNGIEYAFDEVTEIQRLDAGVKSAPEVGSWHDYQINLVLSNGTRYNLLDSAGMNQLDAIGDALARCIRVPLKKYDKTGEQSGPAYPPQSVGSADP